MSLFQSIFFVLCELQSVFMLGDNRPPNFLFIIADDLRPSLGCYDESNRPPQHFVTPNIDRLAENGFLFANAFAQQALCGPSRTSFLTGRRPDTLRTYDNGHAYWRDFAGNFTTIPQYFKDHGYHTASAGKVFHPGHTDDWPYSWSQKPFHPESQQFKNSKVCNGLKNRTVLQRNIVCPIEVEEQPNETLPDIETTSFALEFLRNRSHDSSGKPFFLAVGLHKPHIPLKYPRQFNSLYPLQNITLANNPYIPKYFPKVAWNPFQDLRSRDDVKYLNVSFPYGPLPKNYQCLVRQSYFASVTYIDSLVGEILLELKMSNLSKNTVIIFTSDHGWSLGEHSEWSKYSNFGVVLRVPLILYIPMLHDRLNTKHHNQKGSWKNNRKSSRRITELVELVDLFPTFAEIAGLPRIPPCPTDSANISTCAEGTSFHSLISCPCVVNATRTFKRKSAIYAQYPRPSAVPQLNREGPRIYFLLNKHPMSHINHFIQPFSGDWLKADMLECLKLK